jgi:phosphoribosylformimino-5-aminoimidazole carboxamide ribonucleotide (ProFAR) isomerase
MMFATGLLPLLAVLLASLCGSVQAMDYEVGTSLICDTQTQVERFVALFSGDTQAAIDAVNAEEQNPTACALIDAAYLRGAEIGIARNGDSAFEIVQILVVGIDTAGGIRAVQPSAYFLLFGVKEYAV